MPSSAFFSLFHKQKKFTESVFSKLFANPYASLITADFTNHFCLLYQILEFLDFEIDVLNQEITQSQNQQLITLL
jgi:hypothetical protein